MTRIIHCDKDKCEVEINKADMSLYDEDQWKEIKNIFNHTIKEVNDYGWTEGFRNTYSVNLMIAAEELGIIYADVDDIDNLYKIMTSYLSWFDLDDFRSRAETIAPYLERWHGSYYSYMLDIDCGMITADLDEPVSLVFTADAVEA